MVLKSVQLTGVPQGRGGKGCARRRWLAHGTRGAQPKPEELLQSPHPLRNAGTFLGWTIQSRPGLSVSTHNGGFSATHHSPEAPSLDSTGPLVWGMKGQSCNQAQGKQRRGWMWWVTAMRGDGANPSSNIPTCTKPVQWPSPAPRPSIPRTATANWGTAARGDWPCKHSSEKSLRRVSDSNWE